MNKKKLVCFCNPHIFSFEKVPFAFFVTWMTPHDYFKVKIPQDYWSCLYLNFMYIQEINI